MKPEAGISFTINMITINMVGWNAHKIFPTVSVFKHLKLKVTNHRNQLYRKHMRYHPFTHQKKIKKIKTSQIYLHKNNIAEK